MEEIKRKESLRKEIKEIIDKSNQDKYIICEVLKQIIAENTPTP